MIQGIARESFNGDGDALIVHKQPHLDNGELPFFLTDTAFALPFLYDISFLVKDVLIRSPDLKIEVGRIIIDDLRRAVCLFDKACVDAADNLILIVKKEIQGVKDVVRVVEAKDRLIVILILTDGSGLGGGVKSLPKKSSFAKP